MFGAEGIEGLCRAIGLGVVGFVAEKIGGVVPKEAWVDAGTRWFCFA